MKLPTLRNNHQGLLEGWLHLSKVSALCKFMVWSVQVDFYKMEARQLSSRESPVIHENSFLQRQSHVSVRGVCVKPYFPTSLKRVEKTFLAGLAGFGWGWWSDSKSPNFFLDFKKHDSQIATFNLLLRHLRCRAVKSRHLLIVVSCKAEIQCPKESCIWKVRKMECWKNQTVH